MPHKNNFGDKRHIINDADREKARATIEAHRHDPVYQAEKKEKLARKRNFRQLAQYILTAELPKQSDVRQELLDLGLDQTDMQTAMLVAQLKKAIRAADTEAAKYMRDSAGWKPTEAMQVGALDTEDVNNLNLAALTDAQLMAMINEKENKE